MTKEEELRDEATKLTMDLFYLGFITSGQLETVKNIAETYLLSAYVSGKKETFSK